MRNCQILFLLPAKVGSFAFGHSQRPAGLGEEPAESAKPGEASEALVLEVFEALRAAASEVWGDLLSFNQLLGSTKPPF